MLSQCYSKALSNAFQDSSGTEATECRLEKIKRLGPEGRDQGRKAAPWAGRSDVNDDLKQDCSSLWLWSEGQWGRGKNDDFAALRIQIQCDYFSKSVVLTLLGYLKRKTSTIFYRCPVSADKHRSNLSLCFY